MSIHKAGRRYVVRWREGTANRQRTFDRHGDAKTFESEVRRRRQLGTLTELDAGRETLDEYTTETWGPAHAAHLAPKTRKLYGWLYDSHIGPRVGPLPLCEITPDVIGRLQADLASSGVPPASTAKAMTLLGGILQRAAESRRIPYNPARLVRKATQPPRQEVRPLAPATVEALRDAVRAGAGRESETRPDLLWLRERDATLLAILAYAGIRPQEARGLLWGHVHERTLVIHAPKTQRHRTQPRTVRLLAPLRSDLAEWRMACGRPDDSRPVIPGADRQAWTANGWEQWRGKVWKRTMEAAGMPYQRPYDLRHSFASLLLHEGRSAIYVARQLGHNAMLTMTTYGHVIDELEDAPRLPADEAIRDARMTSCSPDVRKAVG